MSPRPGRLVVLSGPSGVGKTTVGEALLDADPRLARSVSVTTRKPRPGEEDGRDYHFVAEAAFAAQLAKGAFLEHAQVHGNRYGTPREPVERLLAEGRDVLLVIDVQGARQVQEKVSGALFIFLKPPSETELESRLSRRGTEDRRGLERRLQAARSELAESARYDHVVVNDRLEETVRRIRALLEGSIRDTRDTGGLPE